MTYQSLVGNLKGASAGNLIIDCDAFILVGNQVAVDVIVQVVLRDLIAQN
jgi:hypothetical protein